MAGIFTRPELAKIMGNNDLTTEEKTDRIFSMYGQSISDGYMTKTAAREAQESAINAAKAEWEKNLQTPDVKESEEYKALQAEYTGYKAEQEARTSEDYKGVKGKFFHTVYGMIDHSKPVSEQMPSIKEAWPEYFEQETSGEEPPKNTPQFSKQPGHSGANPESDEDKLVKQLSAQWS